MHSRVAIVTGVGGGIGEATGRVFAEEGGAVVILDASVEAAGTAARGIVRSIPGARVSGLGGEVTREEDVRRAVGTGACRTR